MKQYPNSEFCWFSHSSSGVHPVVSSHTRPCGHFKGCTKSFKKNKRRVEGRTDKQGFRTANADTGSGTLKHSCMDLSQDLNENLTQPPKMLTHMAIVFIPLCLDSILRSLTPNWPLPSPLLTDSLHPFLLVSQGFAGTALCVLFTPK